MSDAGVLIVMLAIIAPMSLVIVRGWKRRKERIRQAEIFMQDRWKRST